MVIVCEKCNTRFHLADGRVPEDGARVRCSKCHHRFHVAPPRPTPEPRLATERQHSAKGCGAESEPEEKPDSAFDDPDLENPEFLFDGRVKESEPDGPPSLDLEPPPAPKPQPEVDPEDWALLDPDGIHASTAVSVEERESDSCATGLFGVTESRATRAPAESLSQVRSGTTRSGPMRSGEARSDSGWDGDQALGEEPTTDGTRSVADDAVSDEPTFSDLGLLDDSDDGFDAWGDSPPAEISPALVSRGNAAVVAAAAPGVVDRSPASRIADSSVQGESASGVPQDCGISSVDEANAPLALRVAIWALGALLLLGGLRAVWIYGIRVAPGPESWAESGWRASEVRSDWIHDARGRRALLVRGRLSSAGADAAAPRVRVTALGGRGEALSAPVDAALADPDRIELPPPPFGVDEGDRTGAQPEVAGFVAVLPDPHPDTRRFRIEIVPAPTSGGEPGA